MLQIGIFDDYGALFDSVFTGNCRVPTSKNTSPKGGHGGKRELGIVGKFLRIRYRPIGDYRVGFRHEKPPFIGQTRRARL